jgi:uncharacterized membrane protein YebE (DUF533 family)
MSEARKAMEGWMGALARGGVIDGDPGELDPVAALVVGHDELVALDGWMRAQPDEVRTRERRAAIEVCIWMANADRQLDGEEVDMLRGLIERSGLSEDVQDELVMATHDPPSLESLESRLTNTTLRELMLALAWEMASADGNIARSESAFYTGLAKRLDVSAARAAEIQRSIAERLA